MRWAAVGAGLCICATAAAAAITITADPAHTRAISPWIYGINFYEEIPGNPRNLTLNRAGGNRWTAYNWENNASNAGSDWYYSSDDYLGGGNTPAEAVRSIVDWSRTHGAASLLTFQLQGYVAADKNGNVNINDPNHLATRFKQVVFQKGSAFTATPSTTDANVYMDEFLWALRSKFAGDIYADAATPTFVSLDNEPELWPSTHAEIQSAPIDPEAYIQKTISLCTALKAVDPSVKLFGPVHYGFNGIVNWQNAAGFSDTYWFTDKYLLELKAASTAAGRRLLDVYDIHWYSEAYAGSNRVTNLTGASLTDAQVQAIVQSPRSLWDPTYRENSWIADYFGGPVRILDRLQTKIDADWPGTGLAVTEYANGGDHHIAGAIATADNLGIFASRGIFAATYWPLTSDCPFILAGFKMYRDYDGGLSTFGDISIPTVSSDTSKVAVYVSQDSQRAGRYVLVAINRSTASQDVSFRGLAVSGTARIYRVQGTSAAPAFVSQASADLATWVVTLPALSVSTIELTAITAVPPAFTTQPAGATVYVGEAVTFTAAATGTPSPTLQWRKNGADIGGATGATYTIAHAALMDAGTYTVVASNSAGSATSAGATLTVRVTVPPPEIAGDFNGDRQADLIWQNSSTGERKVVLMNGTAPGSEVSLGVVPAAWQIAAVADFNGDGQTDILWQNTQTGERGIWLMIGAVVVDWASLGVISTDWQIAAAADFNHDGKVDVLWENTSTGERKVWLMNGIVPGGEVSLGVVSTAWQIAGAADFNGDGQADILWQNTGTGERGIWLMIGTNVADWTSLGTAPLVWRMVGALDLNGDGQADVVWENPATGARKVWLMNGTTFGTEVSLGIAPTAWHLGRWGMIGSVVRTTVDFNGDGQADLVWQNTATGERKVWLMNGAAKGSEVSLGTVSTAWQIAGAADFNGDGQTDILFENAQTGERGVWLMIGTSVADWASLGTMPVAWRIAAVADFNGDGQVDLVLENTVTGERQVRLMTGTTLGSEISLGVVPTAWQIAGAADFTGDGQTDILWQNTQTGERGVWVMIGGAVADWVSLGTVSTDWQMAGTGDYDGDGQADILWQNAATGERKLWLMHGTAQATQGSLGIVSTAWTIGN